MLSEVKECSKTKIAGFRMKTGNFCFNDLLANTRKTENSDIRIR